MAPVKFQFSTAFGTEAEQQRMARERKRREELEAARSEGFAAGLEQGRTEMRQALEAQIAASLDRFCLAAKELFEQEAGLRRILERDAALLAHAFASRLAPALMERFPMSEVEALLRQCMEGARREARLVARVAPHLVEPLSERLDALKLESGFLGEVVMIGDETLSPQDCRIEWPDGGAERNIGRLERTIEDVLARYLSREDEETDNGACASARNGQKE
ncbi:MAG: hypothetical protein D6757_09845 [Alphaproteobacteria bacterium]|nr:MAG: hypothetical protein D6757_09845 [Alphaproteobacteria bacterium]